MKLGASASGAGSGADVLEEENTYLEEENKLLLKQLQVFSKREQLVTSHKHTHTLTHSPHRYGRHTRPLWQIKKNGEKPIKLLLSPSLC